MWSLWISIFFASLLGSMHCVGMCGGFVAFYAGSDTSKGWQAQWSHVSYHIGRLLTYMILGAVAGGVGAAFDVSANMAGFSNFAGWFAGGMMILWGLIALAQEAGFLGRFTQLKIGGAWLSSLYRNIRGRPPVLRALLLGLSSTLLPCGWLYAFVLPAAATASPLKGIFVMTAFWVGSVPLLLGLGLGVQQFSLRLRHVWPWLSAIMVLVVGILTFWQRGLWAVPSHSKHGHHHHHHRIVVPSQKADKTHKAHKNHNQSQKADKTRKAHKHHNKTHKHHNKTHKHRMKKHHPATKRSE